MARKKKVSRSKSAPKKQTPVAEETPDLMGHRTKLCKMSLQNLYVDRRWQRDPKPSWVRKQARQFQPHLIGALIIGLPTEEEAARSPIVDGQGRQALLEEVGYTKQVSCIQVQTNDPYDLARMFVDVNQERRSLTSYDFYRAMLFCKDPTAICIYETMSLVGYEIVNGNAHKGQTSCVRAILALARRMPALFEEGIVASALISRGEALDHRTMNGVLHAEERMCQLFGTPQESAKRYILTDANIDKLTKVGSQEIFRLAGAIQLASASSWSATRTHAQAVVNILNKGRRGKNRFKTGWGY